MEPALQSNDVQDLALGVHLVELQPASLGDAQPVAEHQKQQATVAGLVAASPGRGNQLSNLKAGQVAASGLAPRRVFLPGWFSLSWQVHPFVESFTLEKCAKPL
jgi:hypothetical protein